MSLSKKYQGYSSFQYLERGSDYRAFDLVAEPHRIEPYLLPLSDEEEVRVRELVTSSVMVSLHEHVGLFPSDIQETPAYVREGRMATAFESLSHSYWDAVFDNLMDGIGAIHAHSPWHWDDVLHDLGMRLCDLAHQDFLIHCTSVDDILGAHRDEKIAWVASIEGAAPIENELDRIDLLYGLGVRALGVTYSESNALGSGLKEANDGGLTVFGRQAVERMNKVGMLIDCSHCGDQTTLDTIGVSDKPILLSHIGARALWDSKRLAPDEVLDACAAKGGVIGIEAAPHTTLTWNHRSHGLDAYMEHFEYVKELVGIDHVGFGPDSLYGDHVGLHKVYAANLSLKEAHGGKKGDEGDKGMDHPEVAHVEGVENPTEASHNIVRWLVKNGYPDEDIRKVVGGNAIRLLEEVWG